MASDDSVLHARDSKIEVAASIPDIPLRPCYCQPDGNDQCFTRTDYLDSDTCSRYLLCCEIEESPRWHNEGDRYDSLIIINHSFLWTAYVSAPNFRAPLYDETPPRQLVRHRSDPAVQVYAPPKTKTNLGLFHCECTYDHFNGMPRLLCERFAY